MSHLENVVTRAKGRVWKGLDRTGDRRSLVESGQTWARLRPSRSHLTTGKNFTALATISREP